MKQSVVGASRFFGMWLFSKIENLLSLPNGVSYRHPIISIVFKILYVFFDKSHLSKFKFLILAVV
jgi:hypothetical protein